MNEYVPIIIVKINNILLIYTNNNKEILLFSKKFISRYYTIR